MELAFPLLLKLLIQWIEDEEQDQMFMGYVLGFGLSFALAVKSYMNILGTYFTDFCNAKIRSAIKVK